MIDGKRVVAIIQARMGSSRLPGKVLMDLGGMSALEWMVRRVRLSETIDEVVIATTMETSDDPIEAFCADYGVGCFRGSLHDVLDRFYQAAKKFEAEICVRLTGDCPFVDPWLLDENLNVFVKTEPALDFAANRLPPPMTRTVPIGLDAEYCTLAGLEKVWQEATAKHEREHVMPYFYEHPEIFNILHIENEENFGEVRWTLDTAADYAMFKLMATHFAGRFDFSWKEALDYYLAHPELAAMTEDVTHKTFLDTDERA